MRHLTVATLALAALAVTSPPASAQDVRGDALEIVEGYSGVDPETGFVRIRGEIRNNSGKWISAARVYVELFDGAGKPISVSGFLAETKKEMRVDERDSVMAQRHFVPPGETAVFEYIRDPKKLGARYGSHKLEAAAWAVEGEGPRVVIDGFKSAAAADGTWEVSGTIRNAGRVACRSPKAVLGFYSSDGKVALATDEEPGETFQKQLASGGTVRFSRSAIAGPAGARIAKVVAWGDCAEPD